MKIKIHPTIGPDGQKIIYVIKEVYPEDGVIIERAGQDMIDSLSKIIPMTERLGPCSKSHVLIRIRKSARAYAFYVQTVYSNSDSSTIHQMTSALENVIKEFMSILSHETVRP